MNFNELGLSEKVLQAVETSGYTSPTPIQMQAIPHALQGRDILGIAQTGTGKTAAFTLPMLSRLESGRARARMPRTLILEPTRELAAQVEESFIKYGAQHKLNVALLIGGMSFGDQETKIMRGADVLIATPGRLLDFFERGKLLLTGIEILVIDEADRMLDMGFIPDIEKICKLVPFTRQTLFFSATMPPEITRLTEQFLHNPIRIEVQRASTTASTITQGLVASHGAWAKREKLREVIRSQDNLKNAIIFCNRKRDVAILHNSLTKHGFSVGALHGDMDQHARMASLDAFKSGEVAFLVCSDVAARGLDIPDVSHVFNFDVPTHSEDYVHRIGRTGRAGKSGVAYTIVTDDDRKYLAQIEKLIGNSIDWIGPDLDALGPDEAPRVRRDRQSLPREANSSSARRGGRGRKSSDQSPTEAVDDNLVSGVTDGDTAPVRRSRRRGGSPDRAGTTDVMANQAQAMEIRPLGRRKPAQTAGARTWGLADERGSRGGTRNNGERSGRERRPVKPETEMPRATRYGDAGPMRSDWDLSTQPAGSESVQHAAEGSRSVRGGRVQSGDRHHRHDNYREAPVIGMGDHTPSFLLRPVKLPVREPANSGEE